MGREEEGLRTGWRGVEGHWGLTDRHKWAGPGLNPGGRAGPPGWGTRQNSRFLSDTQFNSEAVFLVPRRFFQLAIVSFTDGFAAANYKFVSNSFPDALKKKALSLCKL